MADIRQLGRTLSRNAKKRKGRPSYSVLAAQNTAARLKSLTMKSLVRSPSRASSRASTRVTTTPVTYEEYKNSSASNEDVMARKIKDTQEVFCFDNSMRAVVGGGQGPDLEDYVHVYTRRSRDTFAKVIRVALPTKKHFAQAGRGVLAVYNEDSYKVVHDDEIVCIHWIPYVELLSLSFSNSAKDITMVHTGNDKGTDSPRSSSLRTTVFSFSDTEEARKWMKCIIQGIRDTARVLQAVVDSLIEFKARRVIVEMYLRQMVDLYGLSKGKTHRDTLCAMEQLANFLEDIGKDEEGSFWQNRGIQLAEVTESHWPSKLEILIEEIDEELQERPLAEREIIKVYSESRYSKSCRTSIVL